MCEEIGALYLGLAADPREKATQNETAGDHMVAPAAFRSVLFWSLDCST
jgi:hypothetical protein